MRIQVTKTVFYDNALRRPGDTMDLPDGTKGDWFDVAQKASPPKKAGADEKDNKPSKA